MLLVRYLEKRDQGDEAFVADYTHAFLNGGVREGELRTSPRQEQVSSKLKEHGSILDARDPCLFAKTELDICIGCMWTTCWLWDPVN